MALKRHQSQNEGPMKFQKFDHQNVRGSNPAVVPHVHINHIFRTRPYIAEKIIIELAPKNILKMRSICKDWKSLVDYHSVAILKKCCQNGLLKERKWLSLVQISINFDIETNVVLDFLKILISESEKHRYVSPLHVASEHGNLDLGEFSKLYRVRQ